MQLRELLLCWKPGVMPLHAELKAWSDAKTSFRSWPDAFDLKGLILLFACTDASWFAVYIVLDVASVHETILYGFLGPKCPSPNASLGNSMQM